MSTTETVAPSESEFLAFAPQAKRSQPAYARILAWPPLHMLTYLCSDLFAVTLAHMLGVRLISHFLHVPQNALNPFEYHRLYIPFFAVVLYLFEGYKSPELRRPEQELEKSCKAMAVSFLGLVLFNFVVLRSESFSRYLLLTWFVLACFLLVLMWALGVRLAKEWPRFKELLKGSPAQKELEAEVDGLINSLADLDELFTSGKLVEKHYWKERLDLKARLMASLKKASPALLESYATRHTSSR